MTLLPAPLRFTLVAAALALSACERAPPMTADDAANAVKQHGDWMADSRTCPADAMDRSEVTWQARDIGCDGPDFSPCHQQCADGSVSACMQLARALEQRDFPPAVSNVLYQRGCRLGDASGCTNRAAYDYVVHPQDADVLACSSRTFTRSCALDDPWGCTMVARVYVESKGRVGRRAEALAAAQKTCRMSPQHKACAAAQSLFLEMQGIEDAAP
jgi:hypothetical protein